MSNEIKEILKKLEIASEHNDFIVEVRKDRAKILLDYIIDLQQRNNNLKEDFKRHIDRINELIERNDNLQQENERANQYIDFYKDLVNKQSKRNSRQRLANQKQQELILKLQQENERLKELCDKYEEEHNNEFKIWKEERYDLLDYKSRCEKAIEYNYELQERYCHSAIFDELVASKVYEITEKELNILQNGSEKDE